MIEKICDTSQANASWVQCVLDKVLRWRYGESSVWALSAGTEKSMTIWVYIEVVSDGYDYFSDLYRVYNSTRHHNWIRYWVIKVGS